MCCLIGYIGLGKELKLAERLLLAGQRRGTDATGYVELGVDGSHIIHKKAVAAFQFVRQFRFVLQTASFFGHTRHATCGDSDDSRQAHPFSGTRYVVMHNGWLVQSDWRKLEKTFGIRAKNGVDSELFLSFLEKYGEIEALKDEMLPLISESSRYMLVIYDKLLKKLHFLKDGSADFVYAHTENGLIYASTADILLSAAHKHLHENPEIIRYEPFWHTVLDAVTGKVLAEKPIQVATKTVVAFGTPQRYIG